MVRKAVRIQQRKLCLHRMMPDHDLWQLVADTLPPEPTCVIHHIRSHQTYQDADAWLQWACSANDFADSQAQLALEMLPTEVLKSQETASQVYQKAQKLVHQVHQHFVRVGKQFVTATREPAVAPGRNVDLFTVLDWHSIAVAAESHAPPKLRYNGFSNILAWCRWVHDSEAAPQWMSWYELLFSFQLLTQVFNSCRTPL